MSISQQHDSPVVFATSYLPLREYLVILSRFDEITLDFHENWKKQTLRNRTFILSANGIQQLGIPVQHTGGKLVPVKEIKISYNDPWLRLHQGALEAAYNTSPFFEFIKDDLWSIYQKKHTYLIDLNTEVLVWMIKKFKLKTKLIFAEHTMDSDHADFKKLSYPGHKDLQQLTIDQLPEYNQVFGYKFDFQFNLSGIDLLANVGHL
ncbi:WbqC family protein [soil metagenome]